MKRFIGLLLGLIALSITKADAVITSKGALVTSELSVITVSSTTAGAGGIGLVVTSTPTAATVYSSGQYVYVTHIHIEMYATSTLTGGATPVTCTSVNISGTPKWLFPTAQATGVSYVIDEDFSNPLQSITANNAININCPATTNVLWNAFVSYYIEN